MLSSCTRTENNIFYKRNYIIILCRCKRIFWYGINFKCWNKAISSLIEFLFILLKKFEKIIIVTSKVSDPIKTLINFLHESWWCSFVSIYFSVAVSGKIFRASFHANFRANFRASFGSPSQCSKSVIFFPIDEKF